MKKEKFIDQVLQRIKHSAVVYDQASRSVHSTIVKKELSEIGKRRQQFLQDLRDAFYSRRKSTHHSSMIWSFIAKIWLKLNDLFIHRNVPNILITCVTADKELLESYRGTNEHNLSEKVSRLINQQRSEVQKQANNFQKRINKYPWI